MQRSERMALSMTAYLVLEDGSIYEGQARGAFRETACEVVFNTSMTGYLEILTDPSYAGQGIVMTYPMIGNYGIMREDFESDRLQPRAFIVRELSTFPSNFRCEEPLEDLLKEYDIPCISGVDTRAIVKKLRESGTMRGILTSDITDKNAIAEKIGAFAHHGLVESVSTDTEYIVGESNNGARISLMDYGTKRNIAESLAARGCRVTVEPCGTDAQHILDSHPDGIMLSNGPGDPADCKDMIQQIKILASSGVPIFAICLGHQLMALSQGAKTQRMKYGHRGANHPVKFLDEDRTFLSSQNHGYMVSGEDLPGGMRVNVINVNDNTVEGMLYEKRPIFTVQFHPEASPGPRDTSFLFDRFLKMIAKGEYCDD